MSRPIKEQLAQADLELKNCLADLKFASWRAIKSGDIQIILNRVEVGMEALTESLKGLSENGENVCDRLAGLFDFDIEGLKPVLLKAKTVRWITNDLDANLTTLSGLGLYMPDRNLRRVLITLGVWQINTSVGQAYTILVNEILVALIRVASGERRGKTEWLTDWLTLLVTKTLVQEIKILIAELGRRNDRLSSDEILEIGTLPGKVAALLGNSGK